MTAIGERPDAALEEIREAYEAEFPPKRRIRDLDAFAAGFKLACEASLYRFAKYVLGMRRKPGQLVGLSPTLHRPVCDWLQDMSTDREHQLTSTLRVAGGRRKLLMLPVVHLKTSIASHALPLHVLIQPPDHNLYFPDMPGRDARILLHGETTDKAGENAAVIRQHLESNPVLRWMWPDMMWNFVTEAPLWKASMFTVRRSGQRVLAEPTITAIGVTTGLEQRHYDCLAAGTLVYTSNGLQPIEQLYVGARVLTSTGHHREVLALAQRRSDKRRIRVRIWGQPEDLVCTEDHRILTYRENRVDWCEAGQLRKGDYLALALPSGRTRAVSRINPRIDQLLLNARVWRLLGYWLAEGAASDKNRIRLTFGASEIELARDVQAIVQDYLGVNCTISEPTASSTLVVSFFDAEFKALIAKFGTHAWNKHLPPFALATEANYQRELLRGYFAGDGHRLKHGWGAVSVSRSLVAGLQLLLGISGVPSGIRQTRAAGTMVMGPGAMNAGKTVNARAIYEISSNHPLMGVLIEGKAEFPRSPCRSVIIPGFMLTLVRQVDVEEPSDEPVYDIQVREDESFCVPGTTVHNCIVMDDLATLEAAQSETVMNYAKVRRKACRSRLDNLSHSIEIGVGTHWTSTDIYIDWRKDPSVQICIRAAIEDGQPIWPEKHSLEELLALRQEEQMGTALFSANYMNQPVNPGFTALDWEEVRSFSYDPIKRELVWEENPVDAELSQRNSLSGLGNANLYALHGRNFRGMSLEQLYHATHDREPEDPFALHERRLARLLRSRDLHEEGSAQWERLNFHYLRRQEQHD